MWVLENSNTVRYHEARVPSDIIDTLEQFRRCSVRLNLDGFALHRL